MTHYSDNASMVRVDFFKPGGKWYMTEAHDMEDYYDVVPIHEALKQVLSHSREGHPDFWKQFTVVCLEPYHIYAHPIMIVAEHD